MGTDDRRASKNTNHHQISFRKRTPSWRDEARSAQGMIDDALQHVEALRHSIQSMKATGDGPLERPTQQPHGVNLATNKRDARRHAIFRQRIPDLKAHRAPSPRKDFRTPKNLLFSPIFSAPRTLSQENFPRRVPSEQFVQDRIPNPEIISQYTMDLHDFSLKLLPPHGRLILQPMMALRGDDYCASDIEYTL